MKKSSLPNRYLHAAFRIGLVLKGAFAVAEIVAGFAAWFMTQQFAVALAGAITRAELSEDPPDVVANYVMHAAMHWSANRQHFVALYLVTHGVIKLWLIAGLWLRRLWYYPVAIVVFTAFVAYQLYRWTLTHSMALLALTIVDLAVIGLTWFEFSALRTRRRP